MVASLSGFAVWFKVTWTMRQSGVAELCVTFVHRRRPRVLLQGTWGCLRRLVIRVHLGNIGEPKLLELKGPTWRGVRHWRGAFSAKRGSTGDPCFGQFAAGGSPNECCRYLRRLRRYLDPIACNIKCGRPGGGGKGIQVRIPMVLAEHCAMVNPRIHAREFGPLTRLRDGNHGPPWHARSRLQSRTPVWQF